MSQDRKPLSTEKAPQLNEALNLSSFKSSESEHLDNIKEIHAKINHIYHAAHLGEPVYYDTWQAKQGASDKQTIEDFRTSREFKTFGDQLNLAATQIRDSFLARQQKNQQETESDETALTAQDFNPLIELPKRFLNPDIVSDIKPDAKRRSEAEMTYTDGKHFLEGILYYVETAPFGKVESLLKKLLVTQKDQHDSSLSVCAEGTRYHLQNTFLELSSNTTIELQAALLQVIQQEAYAFINELYPLPYQGMEIHFVATLVNDTYERLGLTKPNEDKIVDRYATRPTEGSVLDDAEHRITISTTEADDFFQSINTPDLAPFVIERLAMHYLLDIRSITRFDTASHTLNKIAALGNGKTVDINRLRNLFFGYYRLGELKLQNHSTQLNEAQKDEIYTSTLYFIDEKIKSKYRNSPAEYMTMLGELYLLIKSHPEVDRKGTPKEALGYYDEIISTLCHKTIVKELGESKKTTDLAILQQVNEQLMTLYKAAIKEHPASICKTLDDKINAELRAEQSEQRAQAYTARNEKTVGSTPDITPKLTLLGPSRKTPYFGKVKIKLTDEEFEHFDNTHYCSLDQMRSDINQSKPAKSLSEITQHLIAEVTQLTQLGGHVKTIAKTKTPINSNEFIKTLTDMLKNHQASKTIRRYIESREVSDQTIIKRDAEIAVTHYLENKAHDQPIPTSIIELFKLDINPLKELSINFRHRLKNDRYEDLHLFTSPLMFALFHDQSTLNALSRLAVTQSTDTELSRLIGEIFYYGLYTRKIQIKPAIQTITYLFARKFHDLAHHMSRGTLNEHARILVNLLDLQAYDSDALKSLLVTLICAGADIINCKEPYGIKRKHDLLINLFREINHFEFSLVILRKYPDLFISKKNCQDKIHQLALLSIEKNHDMDSIMILIHANQNRGELIRKYIASVMVKLDHDHDLLKNCIEKLEGDLTLDDICDFSVIAHKNKWTDIEELIDNKKDKIHSYKIFSILKRHSETQCKMSIAKMIQKGNYLFELSKYPFIHDADIFSDYLFDTIQDDSVRNSMVEHSFNYLSLENQMIHRHIMEHWDCKTLLDYFDNITNKRKLLMASPPIESMHEHKGHTSITFNSRLFADDIDSLDKLFSNCISELAKKTPKEKHEELFLALINKSKQVTDIIAMSDHLKLLGSQLNETAVKKILEMRRTGHIILSSSRELREIESYLRWQKNQNYLHTILFGVNYLKEFMKNDRSSSKDVYHILIYDNGTLYAYDLNASRKTSFKPS